MSIVEPEADKLQDEPCESSPSSVAAETPPADDAEQGSKDSIEEYMTSLLERVRGLTDTARGPEPQPDQAVKSTPVSYVPRFQRKKADTPRCPEDAGTMGAMRELSKLNAHIAIAAHSVKGLIVQAHHKLAIAAAVILITFGAMHLPNMRPDWVMALAWLGTFAAIVCSWQYFRIVHQLSRRPEKEASAPPLARPDVAEVDGPEVDL